MRIFELNIFGFVLAPSYYGLMYALGFIFGYIIIRNRIIAGRSFISKDQISLLDDLLMYIFAGVIIGGRLFYVLFYNFSHFSDNFFDVFKIWEGGMSFHGGAAGVIVAMILFARRYKISFLKLADNICSTVPIGIGLGRIGNYLNAELLGYANYEGIFAVYKNGVGYFPSPLLEAILEGLVLFTILNYVYGKNYDKKNSKPFIGQASLLFLILYGVFRIFVEVFFRTPDSNIGYLFGFLTMGELLSIPMIIVGVFLYIRWKEKIK